MGAIGNKIKDVMSNTISHKTQDKLDQSQGHAKTIGPGQGAAFGATTKPAFGAALKPSSGPIPPMKPHSQ